MITMKRSLFSILIVVSVWSLFSASTRFNPGDLSPAKSTDIFPQNPELTIGLLLPDKESFPARHGAELAILEANEHGGYSGHPFRLVVRTTEGLWGAGSKESVGLVFDDHVLAIAGSLDGRNAHLAEQVATKTKVAFLSTWATDMTLSYAFVPWFFRCVPDDRQQAVTILQDIIAVRKLSHIVVIGMTNYDSRQAMGTFVKTARMMHLPEPKQIIMDLQDNHNENIVTEITKSGIEAVVLIGTPELAQAVLPLFRQHHLKQPVYGTLSIIGQGADKQWKLPENLITLTPGYLFHEKGRTFQDNFNNRYGYMPGPEAAYAYEGVCMIIEAIRKAGPDRDRIIEVLSKITFPGITGVISFDKWGNRAGTVGLIHSGDGLAKPLKSVH